MNAEINESKYKLERVAAKISPKRDDLEFDMPGLTSKIQALYNNLLLQALTAYLQKEPTQEDWNKVRLSQLVDRSDVYVDNVLIGYIKNNSGYNFVDFLEDKFTIVASFTPIHKPLKFEVRIKDMDICSYGIWNNDMVAWKFVNDWNSTQTLSLEDARAVAKSLNN